jgi:hypothetical protein
VPGKATANGVVADVPAGKTVKDLCVKNKHKNHHSHCLLKAWCPLEKHDSDGSASMLQGTWVDGEW